jgi:hypothetical protein
MPRARYTSAYQSLTENPIIFWVRSSIYQVRKASYAGHKLA